MYDYKTICLNLQAQWRYWNCRSNSKQIKVNWLGLEEMLVAILKNQQITDDRKFEMLKEAIDAFTRRGHFEPKEYGPVEQQDYRE